LSKKSFFRKLKLIPISFKIRIFFRKLQLIRTKEQGEQAQVAGGGEQQNPEDVVDGRSAAPAAAASSAGRPFGGATARQVRRLVVAGAHRRARVLRAAAVDAR
jgi:hypothetical protein